MNNQNNWYTNPRWQEQIRRHNKATRAATMRLRSRYPHLWEKMKKEELARINLERGPLPELPFKQES